MRIVAKLLEDFAGDWHWVDLKNAREVDPENRVFEIDGATVGLCLTAGIVTIYTWLGGYRAVAITDVVQALFMIIGLVDTLSNVRRLLVKGNEYGTARCVKATGSSSAVADISNHIAYEMDEIHLRF